MFFHSLTDNLKNSTLTLEKISNLYRKEIVINSTRVDGDG